MYESFYNLQVDPFRLVPDHRFSFRHPSYKKAHAYMQYALARAEGFVMVTGRPGTGKTTLINDLVGQLNPREHTVARLATTQLHGQDFLRA
ncbi:MAG: ATPase, T2SS/T4P/T4SS family, partial [Gammaproteobacteria bacterium]|nr:ATPase, T2SS/T4P/T4SS family [Gammaproteobacteria bacterium]